MFAFAHRAGLQSICADDFSGRDFLDDEVIADVIERVDITLERVRRRPGLRPVRG